LRQYKTAGLKEYRNDKWGRNDDDASDVQLTRDGGYILAGVTSYGNGNSISYAWLIKTDANWNAPSTPTP
jgi:hypothetical protein